MIAIQDVDKLHDGRTTTGRLCMSVCDSFDALSGIRKDWDQFVMEEEAPVFLSFVALRTWWAHYGHGRCLRLFVFRVDGQIVGILPMFVEEIWLGPVWLRVASIVGSDSTIVVEAPPVRARWATEAFSSLLGHLFTHMGCDAVKMGPLSGTYERIPDLRNAVRDCRGFCTLYLDAGRDPHTMFELPLSFDEYLASLSRKQRGGYRRSMTTLIDGNVLGTDVLQDETTLSAEFPVFERLHAAQWLAEGKLGHFQDWPGSSAYHADLIRALSADGRVHLFRMSCGNRIVSYQLCYALGQVLHWVLPARVLSPELERHSLGRLGLIGLIEFAISAGYRRIDGGLGHYDYKLQLGAQEHQARTVVISANGRSQKLRLKIFSFLSQALHLFYYRVWFQRLAPRSPLPRRPLWHLWIRSRL